MFSSGVVMLLIFNAVLPPRFLVRNLQNRVTCTNKPSSHTVSFFVWTLPCRSISCPKTLKNEQTLLYASEICYSSTLFLQFGSGRNSLTEMKNYIPVVRENLKDRSFFPMSDQIKIASVIYSHELVGQALLHTKHPCTVCSLKTLPIATVTISQLYFKIGLSMLWST